MAIYENLPVFKEVYDLLLQFIRLSGNLKRDFRYTIGEQLKKEILELCVFIYQANASHEKTGFISKAREKMVVIKLNLRVLNDTHQISIKQYSMLVDKVVSINKQLSSWDKYFKKISTETSNKEIQE